MESNKNKHDIIMDQVKERGVIEKSLSLAKLATKANHIDEAKILYDNILKLEPENKVAIEELTTIEKQELKNNKEK